MPVPHPFLLLADLAFEESANLNTILFEVFVLGGSLAAFLVSMRIVDRLWLRFLIAGSAVFVFELFTGPMWINERLGPWAYIIHDVSWILTIGWTALILSVVILVDHFLSDWSEKKRIPVYLGILLALVIILETIVVNLGIRSYAPEVLEATTGFTVLGVPIEILYYVPVFTGLVITFYKYWSFVIDGEVLIPVKKRKWLRAIGIAFVAVFLFELMVEPMVVNANFPAWSYIFHDISFLLTGLWVLLIALGAVIAERFLLPFPIPLRFVVGVLLIGAFALPVESWLVVHGYRVYGQSAVDRFSGFTTPISGVASEVAFAIPCYLALIVAFIRYWEITLDNKL